MKHYKHLTQEQRYQIHALLKSKTSQNTMARIIGVSKPTISHDIGRSEYSGLFCQALSLIGAKARTKNTNGLIGQFLPKSMVLDNLSEEIVQAIEDNLNNRPRKILSNSKYKIDSYLEIKKSHLLVVFSVKKNDFSVKADNLRKNYCKKCLLIENSSYI